MQLPAPPGSARSDVYRVVVDELDHGVLLVDGTGTVLAANPSAERILGFAASRVCGGSDVPWNFVDDAGDPVAAEDLPCQRSLRTGEEQLGVVLGVERADGRFAWVEFNARPTRHATTPVAVLSFTDVTARRAEQTRLRELAERDTLTGLYNRRRFEDGLRRQLGLCRERGELAVLMMIDLDGLKAINDGMGHAAGDELLREAADRLAAQVRSGDLLARFGGDEFALLLAGVDPERGADVAERMAATLGEARSLERPAPAASVGAYALVGHETTVEAAIAAADAALYAAKQAGGGVARIAESTTPHTPRRAFRPRISAFEELADADRVVSLQRVVDAARDLLEMDIAYATKHTETEQVFQAMAGDGESFGVSAETRMPLELTYCQKILAGELPHVMPDLSLIPEAIAMPVTHAAGVGAYVSVPITFSDGELFGTLCAAAHTARADLSERDKRYLQLLARLIGDGLERQSLLSAREAGQAATAALRALVAAVEARDHYTGEHSNVVLELVAAVADRLGLEPHERAEAEQVALLHDLGKLAIPDAILHKPGPLDPDEWDVMRGHPEAGARLLATIPELEHLADAVRAEHERWDGKGYPLGLNGHAIPPASRITLVCDAYHAMTSDRPYRRALSRKDAMAEIEAGAGGQFCPEAAAALLAHLGA